MKRSAKNSAPRPEELDPVRKSLARTIFKLTTTRETAETAIPNMLIYRRSAPTELESLIYEPCVCLITQGAKRVVMGTESHVYDVNHFLLTSVDIPTMVQVIKASKEKPCLGLVLRLDMREVAQMMVEGKLPPPRELNTGRGMTTGAVTLPLLSAFRRLLDLEDTPRDIPVLAPVIQREIAYRLLVSEQGARLRQIASNGSQSSQVAQAIAWLKSNFNKQLRVEKMAAQAYMSQSSFHHHFRELTAMSPLQYQKWLRLNEARRLMLTEKFDAATAAMEVGYESPSQFSREYRRLFGAPPLRDIKTMTIQPSVIP